MFNKVLKNLELAKIADTKGEYETARDNAGNDKANCLYAHLLGLKYQQAVCQYASDFKAN